MSYFEGRVCAICGAPIGDNNPDGLGSECRKVYAYARKVVFMQDVNRRNQFYNIKTNIVMPEFIRLSEGRNFRSNFKKSFVPSVIEQYNTKGYLSNKQLNICCDMILQWDERVNFIRGEMGKTIWEIKQKEMVSNWKPSKDESEMIVKIANKERHNIR